MIDQAIRFAASAHKDMTRKGNEQPYIFHPLEVLNLVSMMTLDDDVLCAAVLHDTVEDTPVTAGEIRELFGDRVAALVALLTRKPPWRLASLRPALMASSSCLNSSSPYFPL